VAAAAAAFLIPVELVAQAVVEMVAQEWAQS